MSDAENLDIELLRTFIAVADSHTFSKAGIRLGRTQGAVSQQMQRLETLVGTALFEKEGRTKRLTQHGQQLLSYARDLLLLNDDALRSLKDSRFSGVLRIGSPHDVADTLLPPLLSQIARWAPSLNIELDVGRSPFLMEALHRGEVDMTISTRFDPQLEGVLLRTSPTVWICSAQYQHRPHSPLPLILADYPSIFRRVAIEALDAAQVRWSPAYTTSNLLGIKAAVKARLGVTARSIELLDSDMRVLGESDGLPRLPDTQFYLWIRPGTSQTLVKQAFELVASGFRNT
ncbi:LysR substrate-binding domain-containing protein [Erwiniaceae bacterium L1_54_6]|jgi:DNA-binding transcriptional LysR family regulator|uniref:Transcriptional regulator LrhA n=1 Tax=Pantoea cypripedii TaxID=55209 RepID=A0A6B9GFT0_PANCY|nr:LysR substrate-binding domain-containing protein [Pantoea cypripedii]MDF7660871.1 LysR substrate-binding domain-containing protein [Erwiniaceae bacterium L1_54_6]QGY32609.1 transcriptional regulator LrhA [Pantoea cypripedii]